MPKKRLRYFCESCGHIWYPRQSRWDKDQLYPKRCPNCRRYWTAEREDTKAYEDLQPDKLKIDVMFPKDNPQGDD